MSTCAATSVLSYQDAVYLAALPYSRRLFAAGGYGASGGPGAADWSSFLRFFFSRDQLAGAARRAAGRGAEREGGRRPRCRREEGARARYGSGA